MPLFNYDSAKTAILQPENFVKKIDDFPKIGVSCFSSELLHCVLNKFEKEIIAQLPCANGNNPVYKITYQGVELAVFMSRVGAPASAIGFEEAIAMGLEKLVLFGTCGVLDSTIQDLAIIIPDCAIRDEGTSFHYCEASEEISVNEKYKDIFIHLLKKNHVSYTVGKTWTTDALYRETTKKMLERKQQGAIAVDMECSAMSAVAKFKNVDFFEFFYAADNLDNDQWDGRSLACEEKLTEKEKIAHLAFELAVHIS